MNRPGGSLVFVYAVSPTTNADALPTAVLYRNGATSAISVTVTNLSTGLYKFAATIDPTWVFGDAIALVAAYAISSVAFKPVLMNDVLQPQAADIVANMLATAVPLVNTDGTIGDALNAARAEGFGKWVVAGTILKLYGADNVTVVKTFNLDSATAPTSRT